MTYNILGLNNIPIIGPIFFQNTSGPAYLGILFAVIAWFVLFKTRLVYAYVQSASTEAAETLGINVNAMKYAGVLISGLLGGIGGAVQAQAVQNEFSVITVAGQGFWPWRQWYLENGISRCTICCNISLASRKAYR